MVIFLGSHYISNLGPESPRHYGGKIDYDAANPDHAGEVNDNDKPANNQGQGCRIETSMDLGNAKPPPQGIAVYVRYIPPTGVTTQGRWFGAGLQDLYLTGQSPPPPLPTVVPTTTQFRYATIEFHLSYNCNVSAQPLFGLYLQDYLNLFSAAPVLCQVASTYNALPLPIEFQSSGKAIISGEQFKVCSCFYFVLVIYSILVTYVTNEWICILAMCSYLGCVVVTSDCYVLQHYQ
jgi:hypothetical protein